MKLSKDFTERLKQVLISQGVNEIIFGLDVFDDMEEDEYLVFKIIFNRKIFFFLFNVCNAIKNSKFKN